MKNIIRVKKETNYVVIDKTFLNDDRLSWKAKGILAFMLSKPDDWTFYQRELMKHATDGKTSFNAGFKELRKLGYVRKVQKRLDNGQFEYETIVYERPYTDFPSTDNPSTEKPSTDNRPLLNNNQLSNEQLNNEQVPYVEIINYLNDVADKNYRHSTRKTKDLIKARINEGFTIDDFKKVIDIKTKEWKNDKNMNKYLRPETLFGTKFESYLNQNTVETKNKVIDWDDL